MNRIRSLNRRAITRFIAALTLVAASAGSIVSGTSLVQAANPAEFDAAAVTPEDVASFMALSLDRTDPQYVQAQELLARIMGVDPVAMEDEASFHAMLPAEFGDLPELENGQAAFIVQQQDMSSLVMGGMFVPSMLDGLTDEGSLDDSALESIPTGALQGLTVVLTADNIDEIGAELMADLQDTANELDTPVVTVETVNGSVISTVGVGESVQLDDFEFSAIAQVEGAIVLGFSEDGVLPFVATAEGDSPSLSESSGYQAAMAALPSDVLFASYSAGITAEQIESTQEALVQAGFPLALDLIVEPSGPIGVAVLAADEGFRIESVTLSTGQAPASPVPAATNDLTLDQRVPADTMIFANGLDLGASQAMRAVEQLVLILLAGTSDDDSAGSLEIFTESSIAQQFAGLEMLLGFNAQTDLIQQLQGEYGLVVSSFDLLDPMGFGVLFVSDVANGEVVDQALSRLALLTQVMGEDVPPVTNVTVGDVDVSQMVFDVDGMEMPVQFGVIDDRLLLSVGSALTNFVLGPSSSLADNPAYAEAMGYLPAAEDGIYFVNMPEIVNLAMLSMGLFAGEFSSASSDASPASSADSGAVTDAAVRCGEFADQAAAQEAYDSDPVANFDLDFDFDGEACDDYFAESSGVSASANDDPFGELTLDLQINIGGLAIVTYDDGDVHRMSGILVVPTDE